MPTDGPGWPPTRTTSLVDDQLVSWLDRPGQDPPVLLLHGWGASAESFLGLMRRSHTSRRLLALDLPGFGESPLGNAGWTTSTYAQLVSGWAAAHAPSGYSLLGHSYGGSLSLRLAAATPGPDRVLLCAPSGIHPAAAAPTSHRVRVFKTLRAMARLLPTPISAGAVEWLSRRFGSADYRAASPALRRTLVAAVREDLSGIAAQITVPTLLVWGARDSELPLDPNALRLRELIAPAELVTFDASGHFPFVDEPARFARVFDAFMGADLCR